MNENPTNAQEGTTALPSEVFVCGWNAQVSIARTSGLFFLNALNIFVAEPDQARSCQKDDNEVIVSSNNQHHAKIHEPERLNCIMTAGWLKPTKGGVSGEINR